MTDPQSSFLTDAEWDHLQTIGLHAPGFVQDFKDWANSNTDASPYALEAGALVALSLAAGDYVVLPGFGGGTYLNVFVILVGGSTVVRKTTVLRHVKKVLPSEAPGSEVPSIDVQSDFSKEALIRDLAEAASSGRATLIELDEVSAIFKQMNNAGSYLNGLTQTLTRIYDHGDLDVSRTQKGRTQHLRHGAFGTLLAATTTSEFQEHVKLTDVTSGLLPRFIGFQVDNASKGRERDLEELFEENDGPVEALRDHLASIQQAGKIGAKHSPRTPIRLEFSKDAMRRLNVFAKASNKSGTGNDGDDAIRQRELGNVMKVAGLYKLSRTGLDGGDVELDDVLRAISTVDTAAEDMLRMAADVALPEISRMLDYVAAKVKEMGPGPHTAGDVRTKLTPKQRGLADSYRGRASGVTGVLLHLTDNGTLAAAKVGDKWKFAHADLQEVAE